LPSPSISVFFLLLSSMVSAPGLLSRNATPLPKVTCHLARLLGKPGLTPIAHDTRMNATGWRGSERVAPGRLGELCRRLARLSDVVQRLGQPIGDAIVEAGPAEHEAPGADRGDGLALAGKTSGGLGHALEKAVPGENALDLERVGRDEARALLALGH